ncbi:MAG: hypothetical protein WC211_10740 [Dehalococcoidia bacterium]
MALAALALIAGREQVTTVLARRAATPLPTPPPATATPTPTGPPLVRAAVTANLYATPDRTADVIAVVPAEQRASLDGRTADLEWVRVAYPAGRPDAGAAQGWLHASAVRVDPATLAAAPVVAAPDPTPAAGGPDLALAAVMLIDGKQFAVTVRNVGDAPSAETVMTLDVTRAEGDVIGHLTIEPASLGAGQSATVVTPLTIQRPGTYRVVLDPGKGAKDARPENNRREVILIPGVFS